MMKRTRIASMAVAGLGVAGVTTALAAGHGSAGSQPEPWNPAELRTTLAEMPAGDAGRGERLNTEMMCASCHGGTGESWSGNWSDLGGQRAEYTYKVMLDYKSGLRSEGTRRSGLMQYIAKPLTRQDMADLAAYYESLPLPPADPEARQTQAAEELVRAGDPSRLITPCSSCHGRDGQGGINETPALAGQDRAYFIRTMNHFKNGQRDNDLNEGMSVFARQLTDGEIEALADYYAAMGSE